MNRGGQLEDQPRDAFDARFTRAQVEWALWRLIVGGAKRKPSSLFKIRTKHLLEFDRSEPRKGPMAFSDSPPEGRGEHGLFSAYDAVLLAIGHSLLDLGFKRKEVVLVLRRWRDLMRPNLGAVIAPALKLPLPTGLAVKSGDKTFPRDLLVLAIRRVTPTDEGERNQIILCHSMEATNKIVRMWLSDNLILLSLGRHTTVLPPLLVQAPPARRGRG